MALDSHDGAEGGLEAQLVTLYQEREKLERELGTSDAHELVAMVRSLEQQLGSLYHERESETGGGSDPASEIRSLRSQFAEFGSPEIIYEAADGRRLLRAVWKSAA
ncbi:MAG: hypothetical protein ACK4PI_11475 [Tepidisphaerales bacterium]